MMAHQAKIRMVAKDPAEKLARQRLSVLQLAQALGSVSAACRRSGMDRTSFYDWKRRFQTHGPGGAEGPAAGAQDAPDDHAAGGGGAGPGAVARTTRPGAACGSPTSCSWRASASARRRCRAS